jgi:hypothetical protein
MLVGILDRVGHELVEINLPFKWPQLLSLCVLTMFSWADLRYRTAPGIGAFFLGAVLIAGPKNPLLVGLIVLAVGWGWFHSWPAVLAWSLLLAPVTWAVLTMGIGVRKGGIGHADLLAVGALACLFPWPALVLSLVVMVLWGRWWTRFREGPIPALPGILIGLCFYVILAVVFLEDGHLIPLGGI